MGLKTWYNRTISSNTCFRCGKQRIVSKTYKKIVDGSSVIYTETTCPDPECQKAVMQQLKMETDKREQMAIQKENQTKARLAEKRRGE